MLMNSGLILAGDKPDLAGGMFRANEQAFAQGQRDRENALQTFMRDQGQGLYSGDANAMQAYAAFDPQAAMTIRNGHEARARAQAAAARAAAAASRRNAAAATEQQNEALRTAFRVMSEAHSQGPEAFAAAGQRYGYTDEMDAHGITFDNFSNASRIVNAEMGWEQPEPAALPDVNFDIPDGYMLADPQNPRAGVVPVQGMPAAQADIRNDQNGVPRYVGGPNAGQQVFGGVEAAQTETPAMQTLRARALEGGLVVGTPEYETFMLNSGSAPTGTRMTVGADGSVVYEDGAGVGVGGGMPDMTGVEANNAGFYARVRASNEIINELEQQGTSLGQSLAANVPIVGNYMVSDDFQRYNQAKQDFINAQLRRESGAAISDPEYTRANEQYFPQPGDSPAVIAQKRQNRENAILGMQVGAGDAMGHPLMGGNPTPPPAANIPQAFAADSNIGSMAEEYGLTVDELWNNLGAEGQALWQQ